MELTGNPKGLTLTNLSITAVPVSSGPGPRTEEYERFRALAQGLMGATTDDGSKDSKS